MNNIKNNVKKMLCVGLLFLLMYCLIGCAKEPDVPVADIKDITESVENVIGFDAEYMTKAGSDYIFEHIDIDAEAVTDCVMKLPIGINMNEYGVFIAEKGHEKELESAVMAYLEYRKDVWDKTYLPEEGFKIENAEYGRQGRYVYYAIGCDSFKEVEEIFKDLIKG